MNTCGEPSRDTNSTGDTGSVVRKKREALDSEFPDEAESQDFIIHLLTA